MSRPSTRAVFHFKGGDMSRKTIWDTEPHIGRLYWFDTAKLYKIYPAYKKSSIQGLKSKWSGKIKRGEIPMPQTPEQEPTPVEGRLYKTWEVSAFDPNLGEFVTTTNHGYDFAQTPDNLAEVFEPAVAAKITPTKRKRAERLGRQILVFGDSQIGFHRVYDQEGNDELIPTHSEEALSVLTQINAQERPEEVVNLSDTVDFAEMSRFDPASDSFHRTLGPSLQRAHDLYAQLRADNPDASITEVDSNHTARVQKAMMKKMPELYGLILPGDDYPLMSYYRLANLGELEVNFISGYGAAEYVYGEDNDTAPIIFKHGTTTSSAPGATARKESSQNPTTHVVRGHGHSFEHIAQTTRDGKNLHYMQLGTTCATTGSVPSYHSAMDDFGRPAHNQENWQNQLLMITDVDGQYQFDVIDILNGIATYNGRRYDGNE